MLLFLKIKHSFIKRGQSYDGASNMIEIKRSVTTKIQSELPLEFLTHCYGHTLNLAVNDMIKEDRLLKNTMDTTSELSKFIKKSPKREGMLQKIRDDLSLECPGFRVLCPTRWTVRANTLKSILDNWTAINSVWTISLGEKLDPEMRGRIIGVQAQMVKFEYFFGINSLQILLRHSDNLSKTLQSPKITASEGQKLSNLAMKTLISLRSDTLFNNPWERLKKEANTLGIEEPSLPRKQKRNGKLLSGNENQFCCDIEEVAIYYKRVCFNAIFFFYLGFLPQPFTNHRTAREGGGHFFNSSLPLPLASQTLRH